MDSSQLESRDDFRGDQVDWPGRDGQSITRVLSAAADFRKERAFARLAESGPVCHPPHKFALVAATRKLAPLIRL